VLGLAGQLTGQASAPMGAGDQRDCMVDLHRRFLGSACGYMMIDILLGERLRSRINGG
jgi:hypothetical protein